MASSERYASCNRWRPMCSGLSRRRAAIRDYARRSDSAPSGAPIEGFVPRCSTRHVLPPTLANEDCEALGIAHCFPNDELQATRLGELPAFVRLERAADVTHD